MAATMKRCKITCAGCGYEFRWRVLEALARRLKVHRCWEPAPTFKTHQDLYGEPDPDWKPRDG